MYAVCNNIYILRLICVEKSFESLVMILLVVNVSNTTYKTTFSIGGTNKINSKMLVLNRIYLNPRKYGQIRCKCTCITKNINNKILICEIKWTSKVAKIC